MLLRAVGLAVMLCAHASAQSPPDRPTIMLVGYRAPSNEMLREFSESPDQNPVGWVGANWESRGYDVRAFFPEFPENAQCSGVGDFEVDYQQTTADFQRLAAQYHPVAILTFSISRNGNGWGLEPAYQRWRLPGEPLRRGMRRVPYYLPDCSGVNYPFASPIRFEPVGRVRMSNLPMPAIVEAVGTQLPPEQVSPFIYPFDPESLAPNAFTGNFLSGYVGYLAAMYRDSNQPRFGATPCYLSGHVHIGYQLDPAIGAQATEITVRTVIDSLDAISSVAQLVGGACCDLDHDWCRFCTPSNCNGTFIGAGSACVPGGCPSPRVGSCCYPSGTCTLSEHDDCDDGHASWAPGGVCSPNPCPAVAIGTCCRGVTCNPNVGPDQCLTSNLAAGALYAQSGQACDSPASTPPCCPADYNKSGTVSAQDIFDYLADWMAAASTCVMGGDGDDGAPNAQDLFAFLAAWFSGCP